MGVGKILVIDDNPQIRQQIRQELGMRGYEVLGASSGEEALEKLHTEIPDLLLIDVDVTGMNAIETCRTLRAGSEMGLIVVSERNSENDIVRALDAGADDYITKPFRAVELLARVRAVLRRSSAAETAPARLLLEGVEIDFQARQIMAKDGPRHLTPKEFELLKYLVVHAGRVMSHRRLLQAIWGPDYDGQVDYLRVFINQLRKKIEADPSKPKFIVTEPWVGYRFVMPERMLRAS